jgi:uncharacterized damage-inducible protein DinB
MVAPQYPAGPYEPEDGYSDRRREQLIAEIEAAPAILRSVINRLTDEQLDTRYRNWSIRQIVHHMADSHVNSYIRYKWALTEERPTIKAYNEGRWVALEDSRTGALGPPLALFEGLHIRWVQLLRALSPEQHARAFVHPETGEAVRLSAALPYYAWHCRHHTGQIAWLRDQNRWK